jgi:hypothetical protein
MSDFMIVLLKDLGKRQEQDLAVLSICSQHATPAVSARKAQKWPFLRSFAPINGAFGGGHWSRRDRVIA